MDDFAFAIAIIYSTIGAGVIIAGIWCLVTNYLDNNEDDTQEEDYYDY